MTTAEYIRSRGGWAKYIAEREAATGIRFQRTAFRGCEMCGRRFKVDSIWAFEQEEKMGRPVGQCKDCHPAAHINAPEPE